MLNQEIDNLRRGQALMPEDGNGIVADAH